MKRVFLTLMLAAASVAPILVVASPPASAAPVARPLLVVLCKFTDLTNEPQNVAYFEAMFGEAGAGKLGLYDYWKDVSYDRISLAGTKVKGWYTIDMKLADWQAIPSSTAGRDRRVDLCASKAKDDVNFNEFAGVVALTNQTGRQEDLFGSGPPTVIAGTSYPNLGSMLAESDHVMNAIVHEVGHSLGIPGRCRR